MAQALISNLNTIQKVSVNLQDKTQKTETMDFGKIFDSKTNDCQEKTDLISTNKINKTSTISNPITDNNTVQQNDLTEMSNELTELSDNLTVETDMNSILNDIAMTDDDTDSSDTELVSIVIADLQNTDTEIAENIENIITEDELNIIEETITQDITITDEEPTMYKELTTLENPTTAVLLQSQIQKTVTQNLKNEQTETSDDNAALKTTNQKLNNSDNNNTTVFNQFDNAKNASIINLAPKETAHTKTENSKAPNIINESMVKELNVEVVNTESAEPESTMGDLMQNQSPQGHTARVMIQGDVKFESLVQETTKPATQIKTTDITPSKIIEQISKQLDGMFNNSKLNMVLNPGTLGKVNLQLVNSKVGLMAQFTVTTQDAKELLLKGLDGLKESLLSQGVSVDNVTVKLEEAESEYKFDWTEQEGSKNGHKHQGGKKQKDDEKNFEQMMFDKENEVNV